MSQFHFFSYGHFSLNPPSCTSQRHPLPSHSPQNYPPPLGSRSSISRNSPPPPASASSHIPLAPTLACPTGLLLQLVASCEPPSSSPTTHAMPPEPCILAY